MRKMSTTARIGYVTLAVQAACLLAAVVVYLVEHFSPGVAGTGSAAVADATLRTIGSIAVGGGIGGGLGAASHGVRHYGTAAPTTSMQVAPEAIDTVPS